MNPNTSKKGKLPLAESMWALEHVARVSEQSKAKGYESMNWLRTDVKCYFVNYLCSAALRHIKKFLDGENYNVEVDKDNNTVETLFDVLHLENAAYNLLMAARLFRDGRTDLDDRHKPETSLTLGTLDNAINDLKNFNSTEFKNDVKYLKDDFDNSVSQYFQQSKNQQFAEAPMKSGYDFMADLAEELSSQAKSNDWMLEKEKQYQKYQNLVNTKRSKDSDFKDEDGLYRKVVDICNRATFEAFEITPNSSNYDNRHKHYHYLGLQDKNGKEIKIGDLVKIGCPDYLVMFHTIKSAEEFNNILKDLVNPEIQVMDFKLEDE